MPRVPKVEKIAPLLLRMAQEEARKEGDRLLLATHGGHIDLTPGTDVEVEIVPEAIPIYTDKKLSVADYGPTLDKVLIATNGFRYEVLCNGKPLGYVVMRLGADHPVEFGTSYSEEIAKYRDTYPGEVRLCMCSPVAVALWWPASNRVVVLHKVGPQGSEWEGRFLSTEEFHAHLSGANLALAVSWVHTNEGVDAAIDVVIGVLDEWIDQGRFEAVCWALREAPEFFLTRAEDAFPLGEIPPGTPPYVEDVTIALGFLTVTARAKVFLGSARVGYFRRVDRYLRETRPAEREELLAGLG